MSKYRGWIALILASWLALFVQLLIIRWISAEIRVLAYLKNLPLLAAFFGLGIGSAMAGLSDRAQGRRTSADLFPFFAPLALVLAAIVALAPPLGLVHLPLPRMPDEFWAFTDLKYEWDQATAIGESIRFLLVVLGLALLIAATFAPLGYRVGKEIARLPRLPAYGVNLAASLIGVWSFMAVSALNWPPAAWWVAAVIPTAALLLLDRQIRSLSVIAQLVVLAITPLVVAGGAELYGKPKAPGGTTLWSPYYRIDFFPVGANLMPLTTASQTSSTIRHHELSVNHDYHQKALNLTDAAISAARMSSPTVLTGPTLLEQARIFYDMPYHFVPQPLGRVLIVGAGTGNDVSAALRAGAAQVDAVEIDPVILRLGRELHPEQPYSNPRVRAINDDARAYFRRQASAGSGERGYDMIVFGLLDSHTAVGSLGSLRLDSYVYTKESLQEASRLLAPGGTLALSFAAKVGALGSEGSPAPGSLEAIRGGEPPTAWLARRLFAVLTEVMGREPLALDLAYDGSELFIAGPRAQFETAIIHPNANIGGAVIDPARLRPRAGAPLDLPTDDWPFLYLQRRGVPFLPYGVVLLAFLGVGAVGTILLRRAFARERVDDLADGVVEATPTLRHRTDWPLFWLGAGFMLVETRAIAELSLLFGSTWTVFSVAISAILALALVSTGLGAWLAGAGRRARLTPWWVGLALALLAAYIFPYGALAGLGFWTKALLGGAAAGLPMVFAGVIFATLFARSTDPAGSFGANLLGALCGGALEYAALAVGNRALALIAMLLYALAAYTAWRRSRPVGAVAARAPERAVRPATA